MAGQAFYARDNRIWVTNSAGEVVLDTEAKMPAIIGVVEGELEIPERGTVMNQTIVSYDITLDADNEIRGWLEETEQEDSFGLDETVEWDEDEGADAVIAAFFGEDALLFPSNVIGWDDDVAADEQDGLDETHSWDEDEAADAVIADLFGVEAELVGGPRFVFATGVITGQSDYPWRETTFNASGTIITNLGWYQDPPGTWRLAACRTITFVFRGGRLYIDEEFYNRLRTQSLRPFTIRYRVYLGAFA